MIIAELKRKVRKLKSFEKTVRTKNNIGDDVPLVWDKFFCLRDGDQLRYGDKKNTALYNLSKLAVMSKDEYKAVIDEYFARVYYEAYIHNGLIDAPVYDAALLNEIGLPPVANEADVKKRFRELAKEHHPDTGGNPEKFIKLMKIYRALSD